MAPVAFGRMPDGEEIAEFTLSAGQLTVKVLNFGAVIRDARYAGIDHPLVLGFDTFPSYLTDSPHFGAVAGRSANRIAGGRFNLDGKKVQLSLNESGHTHLHGGTHGFGTLPWRVIAHHDRSITLGLSSPDGEEGYPGRVEAEVTYTVEPPGTIRMDASATTDAPTLVNLAQHSYFNLDASPDILDHRVTVFANEYSPTDADLIPTGAILPVAGTVYDLREPQPIRRMVEGKRVVYDLNYVVDRRRAAAPRLMARLETPANGMSLDVLSTEPGVQFYDGSMMNIRTPGLGGRRYPVNGGCCFEPQCFPDAPNHPHFPSTVLRPGETYRQTTLFAFSRA
jgi:aldose 1-epimerase